MCEAFLPSSSSRMYAYKKNFHFVFSSFPLHVSYGMRSLFPFFLFLYVTHENLFIAVCLLVLSVAVIFISSLSFLKRIKAAYTDKNTAKAANSK